MDSDLILVLGVCIAAISFPMLVGAFSGARSMVPAIGFLTVGAGLVVYATVSSPGVYAFDELPSVFVRVIADLIN